MKILKTTFSSQQRGYVNAEYALDDGATFTVRFSDIDSQDGTHTDTFHPFEACSESEELQELVSELIEAVESEVSNEHIDFYIALRDTFHEAAEHDGGE